MQQGTRKFFTNERSVPKQSKPSYQPISSTQKQINHPYYAQYGARKQLTKTSSDANLQHPKQEYFKNLNQRRKNDGQMSNLKSQLQNLKNQVNKLISKQTAIRTPQKQRLPIRQQRSDKKINYVTKGYLQNFTDKEEDFSDTASMTSVTTQKVLNQPLRRLEKKVSSQNYDQSYYMQLQNDLLKNEIKNLKNKYVSKKRELTQKCQLLEKKVQFLEVNLQKSEQSLIECRKALQMEIMVIKRQLTMKTEIKNDTHLPQTDKPDISGGEGNEMLQQKLKKLYEQMNDKNKLVNNLSFQVSDLESTLDRKKFELKKETQKSLELSKQLELSKRQGSRLQVLIESEMSKKKDLIRENETLKEKNRELMEENYKKEQIVTGSEQYENRMAQQIELYKKKEDELQMKLTSLRQENKKLRQLVSTNNDEIALLKKSNDDTIARIAQLSRKLKQEQQKLYERQDYYRRLLQEAKQKEQQKIKILSQHFEQQTFHKSQQQNIIRQQSSQTDGLLKEKQRQINKWKAEYKILKLKHEEKNNSEEMKKNEFEQYFKEYIEYKHKKEILEEENKLMKESVESYFKKMGDYEAHSMRLEIEHSKAIENMKEEVKRLRNEVEQLNEQLSLSKSHLTQTMIRNQEQIKYRQELEGKIEMFIQKQLHGESEEQEEENFQDIQQDFDSPQKQTKQKQFLQDDEQSPKSEKFSPIRKPVKSKTQKIPAFSLTQSQKLQLQQLSQSITSIKKRLIQQDQKLAKSIRQMKNKDNQINKLKKQIRQLLQTHEKQLLEIKEKFAADKVQNNIKASIDTQKQVKDLCEKEILLHKQKYAEVLSQNAQMKKSISLLERELLQLRQQTKSLSHLYNVKCSEVEEIAERNTFELGQKEKRIDELQLIRNQRETNLLNENSNLKDEIMTLRLEIKTLTSLNQKIETSNFDQVLKNQIETSKTLRQELAKKNEQVYKVRDNYTLLRSQYDNLRSQAEIEKLKNISQRKNLDVQYQIQIQNLKNKLSVEQKKISSLEQKISLVIQENRKKDSFIQSYIMGKKLPQGDKEFVAEFIKQYEIHLNGKAINEKLKADSQELEKIATYNYRLLKDMAEMKQKMLLYETMEGEVLSLYDSRQSGEVNRQSDFDSPNLKRISNGSSSPSSLTPNRKFKKMYSLVDQQNEF